MVVMQFLHYCGTASSCLWRSRTTIVRMPNYHLFSVLTAYVRAMKD